MRVIFVGAGPGDPDLLTVLAARLIQSCQCCIYAGSLVSPQVLALLPPDAEKHDSASMNLDQIVAVYRRAREENRDVIRLHTGDPSIYGAIREQMNELDKLGIEYEVVPGVSSFQAAAAALKAELTAPEVAQTIILSRAAGRTKVPERQRLDRLAETQATLSSSCLSGKRNCRKHFIIMGMIARSRWCFMLRGPIRASSGDAGRHFFKVHSQS